jgi:serine/threonine protein kinase
MRKIASCILFIHTAQHVHKSIRTSNILLLDTSLPSNLGEPFLIGFDLSRKSKQASEYTRTSNWWQAYYLPPDRQGDTGRAYTMLDDIYSLGVVFLELCLWQSFARWRKSPRSPSKEDWDPSSAIVESSSQDLLTPKAMQKRFIELAQEHVPVVLGSTMSKLIQACLTCTEDESAFGERKDLEDADGIVVGMAYIKQVISVLDNLVL